jgi:endonuclease YncB( thermonuclease family)
MPELPIDEIAEVKKSEDEARRASAEEQARMSPAAHVAGASGDTRSQEPDEDEFGEMASGRASSDAEGAEAPNYVGHYLEAVRKWQYETKGGNDAEAIERLQRERLAIGRSLVADNKTMDPQLSGVMEYLKADLVQMNRPGPKNSEYGEYIREKMRLRDVVFGDAYMVGADSYINAAQRMAEAIYKGDHVKDQYDLLAVRREAALEHFGDPEFIVAVAKHKSDLNDELLVDFDRGDLRDTAAGVRSDALSQVFQESVSAGLKPNLSQSDAIASFQKMRAYGREIMTDQKALMDWAEGTAGSPSDEKIGLAALRDVSYSTPLLAKWTEGLSAEEKRDLKNNPVSYFKLANDKFQEDLKAGRPETAESFAILEKSALTIRSNTKWANEFNKASSNDEKAILARFGAEQQKKEFGNIGQRVEQDVLKKMGRENIRDQSVEGDVEARQVKGQEPVEAFSLSGTTPFMEVIDGSHVRVAKSAEDLKNGKGAVMQLAGLAVPKLGTSTRSGDFDAGRDSKEHLEVLIAANRASAETYGKDNPLGFQVIANEKGEQVLKLTLLSGEDVSQRMIRDGYGIPTKDVPGSIRMEHLAKQAQGGRRGLWREGFAEVDATWRADKMMPGLSEHEKRNKVVEMVGLAMVGSSSDVNRRLNDQDAHEASLRLRQNDTKLFALPISNWSANSKIELEVLKATKADPFRIRDIYNNNMELLGDLRDKYKSGKITPDEKIAHDRLSIGRRVMASALVETGHLTAEQSRKDGHPLISSKAKKTNLETLLPTKEQFFKGVEVVGDAAQRTANRAKGALNTIMEVAMER